MPISVRNSADPDLVTDNTGRFRAVDLPGPTWRRLVALSWPVLAQQLLVLSVTLSDSFLAGFFQPVPLEQRAEAVGHRLMALGSLGTPNLSGGVTQALAAEAPWHLAEHIMARHISYQAAQTPALYLSWFITSYILLVSVGSTALVARFIGAKDQRGAIHVTNQSLLLAVGLGLLGSAVGLASIQDLVRLLGLYGDAAEYAVAYMRPIFVFLVFQVIGSAGIACLVGAGDTRMGFWVLGGVAILNLPLAWCLFLGVGDWHGFGFQGIAMGTGISQLIGGSVVLGVLCKGRAGLYLKPRLFWPNAILLGRLLRVSVPAGVDSLVLVMGQFIFLSIVNRLGDVASSAHGVALRWEALGYLSGTAFGTGAMTLVGQNLGARRPEQAARSGWVALGLGGGLMCFMGALFFLLAPQMFELFNPHPDQRPVVEMGVPVLRLVAFAMPAVACWGIFLYALRGAGDTRVPLIFTIIGMFGVRIPLAYFFTLKEIDLGSLGTIPGLGWGLFGAWMAMFVDLQVRGAFFLYRFASGRWKTINV